MKKILFALGCLFFVNLGATTEVKAEEISLPSANQEVLYDINQGGLQQFEVTDDSGEDYIIIIEEDQNLLKAARSVGNGTYTITKERPLQWKASYKIDVKSNKITRAHSSSAVAYTGSFKRTSLKVDSSIQATYYLKRTLLLAESSINLRARLSGSTISVTY